MSHEIRTPMNAIMGFSDLLNKSNLGDREKDYVSTIKNAGENLLTIINDILDIAKIEAGMMTFESTVFSIRATFKLLHELLVVRSSEKKLKLLFHCDVNVPDNLIAYPTRLLQIMLNIAGNAIKFTQKGTVTVCAKVIQNQHEDARYHPETITVEFIVKDTGIGIHPDKLAYIFDRFRQAETDTTRKFGGTGLGLSIAKQLVELQGGVISVQSVPYQQVTETPGNACEPAGSLFTFSIPYKIPSEKFIPGHSSKTKRDFTKLSDLHILMAEDNKLNIKLLKTLFSGFDIPLDVAENGSICIDKLTEKKYDIILMDMEMPMLSGYEATDIIRNKLKNDIPIIAMTANAMAGEKEKCIRLGMNDYISKPVDIDLLLEKIYELTITN